MPHLKLSHETAARYGAAYGLRTSEDVAEFLGLSVELVRAVCSGRVPPTEDFIAAVLARVPARFEELFDIDFSAPNAAATPPEAPHRKQLTNQ